MTQYTLYLFETNWFYGGCDLGSRCYVLDTRVGGRGVTVVTHTLSAHDDDARRKPPPRQKFLQKFQKYRRRSKKVLLAWAMASAASAARL